MSQREKQEEESGSNQPCARKARDETAGRRDLFNDDQDRKSDNPQHVHDTALGQSDARHDGLMRVGDPIRTRPEVWLVLGVI